MEELPVLLSKLQAFKQQVSLEFVNTLTTASSLDEEKDLLKQLNLLEAKVKDQQTYHKKADTNNKQQLKSVLCDVEVRKAQKMAQEKLLSALDEELSHLKKEAKYLSEAPKSDLADLKRLETEEALSVKHLGLKINKVTGGWLQFVFTNINRQKPNLPYVFSLRLDENRKYIVGDCHPEISDLDLLVDKLNSTNNLSIFVQSVHKRFTSAASK